MTEPMPPELEREVLEAPRQLHERLDVAAGRPAHQMRMVHGRVLAHKVPASRPGL